MPSTRQRERQITPGASAPRRSLLDRALLYVCLVLAVIFRPNRYNIATDSFSIGGWLTVLLLVAALLWFLADLALVRGWRGRAWLRVGAGAATLAALAAIARMFAAS